MSAPFQILDIKVPAGKRKIIEVPLPSLYSTIAMNMPVYIVNGKNPGPVLLVTAAIHGDEVNGVEIIRRLYKSSRIKNLHGTLVAIPVVNLYGLTNLSRYLPDRRDLNRSFPGKSTGSLASRVADFIHNNFMNKADCIIDLHTGSLHRSNLPQIRSSLNSKKIIALAKSFNAPVILKSTSRPGSFRQVSEDLNIPFLLYEAGEALRLDEMSIRYGVHGIANVMKKMKMIEYGYEDHVMHNESKIAKSSLWIRASTSGIVQLKGKLGQKVEKGDHVGYIFDPFTSKRDNITANCAGIIIGKNNLPLLNEGDPIINLANLKTSKSIVPSIADIEYNEYRF